MENTSCGKKCPFVKTGFCESEEECPNYVESWWQDGQSGGTKLVRDCFPKRMMMQMGALQVRFEGVQAAAEEARNETALMKGHFMALVDASRNVIEQQEQAQVERAVVKELQDKSRE